MRGKGGTRGLMGSQRFTRHTTSVTTPRVSPWVHHHNIPPLFTLSFDLHIHTVDKSVSLFDGLYGISFRSELYASPKTKSGTEIRRTHAISPCLSHTWVHDRLALSFSVTYLFMVCLCWLGETQLLCCVNRRKTIRHGIRLPNILTILNSNAIWVLRLATHHSSFGRHSFPPKKIYQLTQNIMFTHFFLTRKRKNNVSAVFSNPRVNWLFRHMSARANKKADW